MGKERGAVARVCKFNCRTGSRFLASASIPQTICGEWPARISAARLCCRNRVLPRGHGPPLPRARSSREGCGVRPGPRRRMIRVRRSAGRGGHRGTVCNLATHAVSEASLGCARSTSAAYGMCTRRSDQGTVVSGAGARRRPPRACSPAAACTRGQGAHRRISYLALACRCELGLDGRVRRVNQRLFLGAQVLAQALEG